MIDSTKKPCTFLSHNFNKNSSIAQVRYIKINILTWLRGFLIIFLHFVWFSLCSGLFWELRDNACSLEKFTTMTLKPRSHVRIIILVYWTWAVPSAFTNVKVAHQQWEILHKFYNQCTTWRSTGEFAKQLPLKNKSTMTGFNIYLQVVFMLAFLLLPGPAELLQYQSSMQWSE